MNYQARLLTRLLSYASACVPAQRERLSPVVRGNGLDLRGFGNVPVMTRLDAQRLGDSLFSLNVPSEAGGVIEDHTSGSTGTRLAHRRNGLMDIASRCMTERLYEWHDVDPGGVMADIRLDRSGQAKPPLGNRGKGWSLADNASDIRLFDISAGIDAQAEWLMRIRPDYLSTYPTNLAALGDLLGDKAAGLKLRGLFTVGEALDNETRHRCETVFGAPIADSYGAQECGYLAAECPKSGFYHVSSESVFMELLDESDNPVQPGTPGRVVVTSLYNYAMPLIRYDLGDYAVAADPCSCGRGLPTLRQVLGRKRRMFVMPDGRRVWPVSPVKSIAQYLPHKQIQITQVRTDHFVLRYVPSETEQMEDLQGLSNLFRKLYHPSVSVETIRVEAIARSLGGKFEDLVSLVD